MISTVDPLAMPLRCGSAESRVLSVSMANRTVLFPVLVSRTTCAAGSGLDGYTSASARGLAVADGPEDVARSASAVSVPLILFRAVKLTSLTKWVLDGLSGGFESWLMTVVSEVPGNFESNAKWYVAARPSAPYPHRTASPSTWTDMPTSTPRVHASKLKRTSMDRRGCRSETRTMRRERRICRSSQAGRRRQAPRAEAARLARKRARYAPASSS